MTFDPRDPSFYDEAAVDAELVRVFDICHGCRMCFNYCPSFPALFDAVDAHEERGEGEVKALSPAEKWKVVDLCYQCKLCYVKCPYIPPHELNVDFPRLMLRAKATRVRREGVTLQDKALGDPDRIAKVSTGIAASIVNWANGKKGLRVLVEKAVGIHRDRVLPPFAGQTFERWFGKTRNGAAGERRVALFETCSINYNYPHIGAATVQVLEHNGFRVLRPPQRCCGMPALDGGDIERAVAMARANVASLLPLVEQGVSVVVLGPTCGYTAKQEWPALVGTDDARRVAAHVVDAGEFLAREHAAGRLNRTFTKPQGKLGYHVPCHLRAQNIGAPFSALLELIPDTTVEAIERCSAFDGTWGMKREYYELSRKYAKKLCRALDDSEAVRLVSDCPLAGLNVTEELGVTPAHPMEVLRDAYGLAPALPAVENVWPGGSVAGCGRASCAGGFCHAKPPG
ncbi:MAG TPA: heterodisulfide reductase-related iron-sulfur binding cluster [Candidatus Eisenbacteria bacterium]|nr:heterodisulfide reductase-related iron-sulfur binding cluster [Candidatus Eisenbacteria bacterium]